MEGRLAGGSGPLVEVEQVLQAVDHWGLGMVPRWGLHGPQFPCQGCGGRHWVGGVHKWSRASRALRRWTLARFRLV